MKQTGELEEMKVDVMAEMKRHGVDNNFIGAFELYIDTIEGMMEDQQKEIKHYKEYLRKIKDHNHTIDNYQKQLAREALSKQEA